MNKKKNIVLPVVASAVVIAAVLAVFIPKLSKGNEDTNQTVSANLSDQDIIIDTVSVNEKAEFFDYDADGTTVELFAVKASDGTTRIALNTCQVCNGSPYAYFVQQGDNLICQNCMNAFNRNAVGIVHGGCNPVPITKDNYQLSDGKITVSSEFLKQFAPNFTNWKKF